jgi:hypothetical protein
MADLGLFVPSRSHPDGAARLWRAVQDTCQAATVLLIGLDDDDPQRGDYPPGPGYASCGKLPRASARVNAMAAGHAAGYAAIGTLGDDDVPETPGWDTRVLAALATCPFVFANDCCPWRDSGWLACHVFMRTETYQRLGYFGPPSLRYLFSDVAWTAWGQACGIAYLDDVVIRHERYAIGTAEPDEAYRLSQESAGADLAAWDEYSRGGALNDDIAKLGGHPFSRNDLACFNARLGVTGGWPS